MPASEALRETLSLTQSTFEVFGFAEPLARALQQCGYATPTAIQSAALPPQLEGADLLALAETGSGKTAAFVLPILQQLAAEKIHLEPRQVAALILAPTRELAIQIDGEVASLARNMKLRRAVVLGGVGKSPQIAALRRGADVLVATPGRLLDLLGERHADLSKVRVLILDEADRMFDMGFIRDIRKIVGMLPRDRRTALFSATMPPEIRSLAHEVLQNPIRVDLSPKQVVVDRIDQKVMIVRSPDKQSRLHTILKDEAASRVIVFTRTKRGADKVTARLAMAGIGAIAIHGNKAQNARQRALTDFSAGHVRVLVATDIAARGIDVSDVTHVINFEMPVEPETYVHRIGRTARKGLTGIAISLCDPSEKPEIAAIERLTKQKIAVIDDVGGDVLPMPERASWNDRPDPRDRRRDGPGDRRPRGGKPQGERERPRHPRERRDDQHGKRGHQNGSAPHSASASDAPAMHAQKRPKHRGSHNPATGPATGPATERASRPASGSSDLAANGQAQPRRQHQGHGHHGHSHSHGHHGDAHQAVPQRPHRKGQAPRRDVERQGEHFAVNPAAQKPSSGERTRGSEQRPGGNPGFNGQNAPKFFGKKKHAGGGGGGGAKHGSWTRKRPGDKPAA